MLLHFELQCQLRATDNIDLFSVWRKGLRRARPMDDYAKDGGKELFTVMHRVLQSNSYRIVKDS